VNPENNSTLEEHFELLEELLGSFFSGDEEKIPEFLGLLESAAHLAGEYEIAGLQDVCLLLQQNIQDQLDDGFMLTDQQLGLLKSGLQSIQQYLSTPDNPHYAEQILDLVKDSSWQSPLNNEDANLLKDMLLTSAQVTRDDIGNIGIVKSGTDENGVILERINKIITGTDEPQDKLNMLSESVETLADLMGQDERFVLQDLCLYLNENLSKLKETSGELNDTQNILLASWANLLTRILDNPDDDEAAIAIIKNLKNDDWLVPVSEVNANIIADMLGVVLEEEIPDTDEVMPVTVPAQYDVMLQELEKACSEDDPVLATIANQTEQLGLAAGEKGLIGFHDICLILQENIQDALHNKLSPNQSQSQALTHWPSLARNYLQDPGNTDYAKSLIDFLHDDNWLFPLDDDNAILLSEMLGIPAEYIEEKADSAQDISSQDRIVDIPAKPHPVSTELVDMLISETEAISENIRDIADKLASPDMESSIREDMLSQFMVKLERFGSASQAAELAGLYQACSVLHENLKFLLNDNTITSQQSELLSSWADLVTNYLMNLGQTDAGNAIVEFLTSENWPKPLISDVAPALSNLLSAPFPVQEDEAREQRQTIATEDDVSITVPDDINQELLDGLLQELPSQTENFSSAIQSLITGSGDATAMEQAQRIAHTVKGAANTVGVKGIANLTHQLEDILILLNKHNRLPSRALSTSLMNAADCLEEMSEALLGQGTSPDNALQVFQEVLDWINRLENEGIAILENDLEIGTPASGEITAGEQAEKATDEEAATPVLRVPANLIDDMIRILGETIIVTTQLQENVRRSNTESESQFNHFTLMQGLITALEKQVESRSIEFGQQLRAVNQSETVNEIFDPLELEQYNELHTITNRLAEAAIDSFELNRNINHDLHELDELLFEQSRLHREVQELVMKTRMVPIKTIIPRLQRSVRQTCRTTGKFANLHLEGTDTLVDSDVLNNLLDPLMHMLRNAIDHGIEDRETRIRNNKDPEGRIDLTFLREGTQVIVRCRDDGAGLNREAIRLHAIKRGIIEPEDILPDHELDRLILLPGFSTRRETTQVSGRGIGMDIIHSHLQAVKGSIYIESIQGSGCLFELRLPITLISSHSLLIRQRDQVLAVSNRGVIQILHPSDSEIINEGEDMKVRLGDNVYDAVNLENLLNLPIDRRATPRDTRPALLVQDENINRIVFLQEILDVRELVIKPLGAYMKHIPGIPGATILGDGSVVPVLDIPELLRRTGDRNYLADMEQTAGHEPEALPFALVVDDSLSARRSLAQVIKDAGYDVRTAKDGLEAVDIIKKKIPDILLVDLEMPRMNGMELSSHIRNNLETADIPIIMVTSRSTEKHRKQARAAGVNIYLTKPFSDDVLLDHISNLLIR